MTERKFKERCLIYGHTWRNRGAAYLDHKMWLFWVIFGRYPR